MRDAGAAGAVEEGQGSAAAGQPVQAVVADLSMHGPGCGGGEDERKQKSIEGDARPLCMEICIVALVVIVLLTASQSVRSSCCSRRSAKAP